MQSVNVMGALALALARLAGAILTAGTIRVSAIRIDWDFCDREHFDKDSNLFVVGVNGGLVCTAHFLSESFLFYS